MVRTFRLRRAKALLAISAAVALWHPRTTIADTYTLDINLLYNTLPGVSQGLQGTNQPATFTLSGCIGKLFDNNTQKFVPNSAAWNLTNNYTWTINVGFNEALTGHKDAISVNNVENVIFTLNGDNSPNGQYQQGWFGLWSPFGNGPSSTVTSTSYPTTVYYVQDKGPDQYREEVPYISFRSAAYDSAGVSLGTTRQVMVDVPGDYHTFSANDTWNVSKVNMTLSSNQFSKYWGAFEATSQQQAQKEDIPNGDVMLANGTIGPEPQSEFNEGRDPTTGNAYALTPSPSDYGYPLLPPAAVVPIPAAAWTGFSILGLCALWRQGVRLLRGEPDASSETG